MDPEKDWIEKAPPVHHDFELEVSIGLKRTFSVRSLGEFYERYFVRSPSPPNAVRLWRSSVQGSLDFEVAPEVRIGLCHKISRAPKYRTTNHK
jgi:hypothetical protein